jgi:hypothetical protein
MKPKMVYIAPIVAAAIAYTHHEKYKVKDTQVV